MNYIFIDVVQTICERGYDFEYRPVDKDGKPENTRSNAIMMYILNPRLKNYYRRDKKSDNRGWSKKYTTETFLYCWARWLMHYFPVIDMPMDFRLLTVLGAMKSPKELAIGHTTHTFIDAPQDLKSFDKFLFSTFLKQLESPGGFRKLMKEGMMGAMLTLVNNPTINFDLFASDVF
jgi:hypothetical protein